MSLRSFSSVVRFAPAALAVALVAPAHADVSKKVIAACKGKMIISTAPIDGGDEKGTIAACKKKGGLKLQGSQNGNDVQEWTFTYTAFLSKTGGSSLKLEFYDGDKYAADQTLTGVDPKGQVIEGDITINEDDGLSKGHKYTIKMVGILKGKEVTVASTQITMQ